MQPITEHDVEDIHLATASEARILRALSALMEALSGPRGDIARAAEKYLTRGFAGAPKPSTQAVVLDMLVQLLWLAATLNVDIGAELSRLTKEYDAAAERSREEMAIIAKQQANRALLQGGLDTPQGRCLSILACGVNLRPEPKDGTWTWRKAVFPDRLVQILLAGGLAMVEGDGASSTYLAVTPRGLSVYNKLSGDQLAAEAAPPPPVAAAAKSNGGGAAAAKPAPIPVEPDDFADDPHLDPEETPFRFS